MFKTVCILLFILLTCSCHTRKPVNIKEKQTPFSAEMEIAYNSPDSLICFGKNITLVLSLKNNTDSIVEFIHNKPFFLIHDYGDGVFIAGEENQRIHIAIEPENSNERIILNPDQIHTFLYPVTADKKFFYNGNNTVRMLLHFQEYASIKTLPVLITCMECYH